MRSIAAPHAWSSTNGCSRCRSSYNVQVTMMAPMTLSRRPFGSPSVALREDAHAWNTFLRDFDDWPVLFWDSRMSGSREVLPLPPGYKTASERRHGFRAVPRFLTNFPVSFVCRSPCELSQWQRPSLRWLFRALPKHSPPSTMWYVWRTWYLYSWF